MKRNFKLERLQNGETFTTSEKGNSMLPLIKSGQEHILSPATWTDLEVGDIAYCKVKGNWYTHLVTAKDPQKGCQISNNQGYVNGWTKAVYGVVTEVINGNYKRRKQQVKKIIYTSTSEYQIFFDEHGNHITTIRTKDITLSAKNKFHLFGDIEVDITYKELSDDFLNTIDSNAILENLIKFELFKK